MGFSSKRLLKPYSCDFSPCTKDSKDMFVSEFREKSPVDEFLIQKTENGGVPSAVSYTHLTLPTNSLGLV